MPKNCECQINKEYTGTSVVFYRMRCYLLLLILLVSGNYIFSQEIPVMTGETIDNHKMSLPGDLKGKFSLLCFASSQKAQADLETWLDPVYQKFIAKTGIMDDLYDVNVLFIPVITGRNAAFSSSIRKKFKETAQEDLRSHVFFISSDNEAVLTSLNISNSDVPQFYLLDSTGKVIYKTSGKYTEEKLDAIDELIE